MVSHSRAPARPDQLRPLKRPRPIDVIAADGRPTGLVRGNHRYRIAGIQDEWRVDDEWWREPISRHYYQVVTDTGVVCTIFHDGIEDVWYEQAY